MNIGILTNKRRNPYKHKINHQPKNYFHTAKINKMILKKCNRIKYQATREKKKIKCNTTNKSQSEPSEVGNPNPKSKQSRNQSTLKKYKKKVNHPDPARKLSANLYNIYHCGVYSEKLLMMDRGNVQNM